MATMHPLPAAGEAFASESSSRAAPTAQAPTEQALVPVARRAEEDEENTFGPEVTRLPAERDVAVPVRDFRVRHLLALTPGQLIEPQWGHGEDVPLAGEVQLAWSEFEVAETKSMVRVTRLV
jgi:hypothetical protein